MKLTKSLKSVGALFLTLALLVGMMSVMGAFPISAANETVSAEKFVADFSEVKTLLGDTENRFGRYPRNGVYRHR